MKTKYILLLLTLILSVYAQSDIASSATECDRTTKNQVECKSIVQPVCGYLDPSTVQCNTSPCAINFNFENSCQACNDLNIIYYVDGECPQVVIDPPILPALPEDIALCSLVDLICPEEKSLVTVCGWFVGDCTGGLCNKTFEHPCFACQNKEIIGFTKGECSVPIDTEKNYCSKETQSERICPLYYQPVCGYFESCLDDAGNLMKECFIEFSNPCFACSDRQIAYWINGKCPSKPDPEPEPSLHLCDNKCTSEDEPVCGYYPQNKIVCIRAPCGPFTIQFKNRCEACKNTEIAGYLPGKCPLPVPDPTETSCPKQDPYPNGCLDIIEPTCGWWDPAQIQCIKYPCAATYSNKCEACHDSKVYKYTKGACPTDLPVDVQTQTAVSASKNLKISPPNPPTVLCTEDQRDVEICTREYAPVCGNKVECPAGDSCVQEFSNICEACKNRWILSYTYGSCGVINPNPYPDNLITCRPKMCPLYIKPVCGISKGCGKDFSNPCFACNDDNVIGYTDGPCKKEDDDVVIDDTTDDVFDCKNQDPKEKCKNGGNYVCGYLANGSIPLKCVYGQCTTYFENRCKACKNKLVEKVTLGLCKTEANAFKNTDRYICKKKDRKNKCTDSKGRVCGIKKFGMQEYPNECVACLDENVIEVFESKCPREN